MFFRRIDVYMYIKLHLLLAELNKSQKSIKHKAYIQNFEMDVGPFSALAVITLTVTVYRIQRREAWCIISALWF